ncbi:hypothetical protein B0181_10225 [Moraxella caviae]|uniref:Type IV secretion system component VirD4 n=1 Tax=Moraxella caviae TaxID=34060 RepID=A0A1S9ZVL3_9GAMM|nr:type IV secretory system conjugative DNA transfer family protein [Moraxella caviae]OOR87524.1 hypothetical protein B0181_10225 [Moraxella caviae]STZ14957.1 type IV secretion system component VirD4 [Moraxella caviae]
MSSLFLGIFLAIALAALPLIVVAANQSNGANSSGRRSRSAYDSRRLRQMLNKSAGEPLAFYHKRIFGEPDVVTVGNQTRGLIVGSSGTGKTNYILAQLWEWGKSGKSFVVTDIKPQIFGVLAKNGFFEHFGYKPIVINPNDAYAHKYNLLDDICLDLDSELDEILYILIPSHAEDAAFADFGRLIFKAIILDLGADASLSAAYRKLAAFANAEKLLNYLKRSENPKVVKFANQAATISSNERFAASGINAIVSALEFLNNDVIAQSQEPSKPLRLRELLKQNKVAVFLQFEQEYQNSNEKLYSATVQAIITFLMSNYKHRKEVLLLFDELLNGGKINQLADKFNTMRSYKLPSFLYIQSIAGIYEKYGIYEADKLMAACDFQVCYRTNDQQTADFFAKKSGLVEVTYKSFSDRPKGEGGGVERTVSYRTEKEQLVSQENLFRMKEGEALVFYRGEVAITKMPEHYKDTPMKQIEDEVRLGDFG